MCSAIKLVQSRHSEVALLRKKKKNKEIVSMQYIFLWLLKSENNQQPILVHLVFLTRVTVKCPGPGHCSCMAERPAETFDGHVPSSLLIVKSKYHFGDGHVSHARCTRARSHPSNAHRHTHHARCIHSTTTTTHSIQKSSMDGGK